MPDTYACLIFQIYPHGSTDTLPFATMGSGSLAAMAIFESKYKEGLTVSICFVFEAIVGKANSWYFVI